MLTNISTIISLIGLTFTLALLTWQTRAVAEQTRISNNIAAASVLSDTGIRLREICMVFVDHPELRPYFYSGKPSPRRGSRQRQVLTIAELLADTLESGLFSYRVVPSSIYLDNWTSYSDHMLTVSPVLNRLVSSHPGWWPNLYAMLSGESSTGSTLVSKFRDLLD